MRNFHVGQKVVCVERTVPLPPGIYAPLPSWVPKVGGVYTIRDIMPSSHFDTGVRLEEFVAPKALVNGRLFEPVWDASRFRPVRATSIDVFTAMLAPTPRVREQA